MPTRSLDQIIERVRTWPESRQDDAVRVLEAMDQAGHTPYQLSDMERSELDQAMTDVRDGDLASDNDVAALKNRYGL